MGLHWDYDKVKKDNSLPWAEAVAKEIGVSKSGVYCLCSAGKVYEYKKNYYSASEMKIHKGVMAKLLCYLEVQEESDISGFNNPAYAEQMEEYWETGKTPKGMEYLKEMSD